jgi:hypothetical protein
MSKYVNIVLVYLMVIAAVTYLFGVWQTTGGVVSQVYVAVIVSCGLAGRVD